MKLTSIAAIYFLLFVFSAFMLLPFGVRTAEEAGTEPIPGQAESAPHKFDLKRHLCKAAVLGAILLVIYYANWQFGWISVDDLDFFNPPVANIS